MKYTFRTFRHNAAALSLAVMAVLTATPVTVCAQDKTLLILHTNDSHSCIMPLSKHLADTMLADRGGYLRRMAMIKAERSRNPKLLLIDSGDFSQGSSYYTLFKGDVEIGMMNMMHYDAATIGNHEFDFGLDNMARLFRKAEFPILCSNYDFTGTPVEGLVKPYTVIKRDGVRIGLFALCPELDGLVFAKSCQGVRYLDPVTSAKKAVAALQRLKCDIIVCVSHLGWDLKGMSDQIMISRTRGIDLVLGGHSHSYLKQLEYVKNLDGTPVPVDQNGKHAVYVGRLELKLKKR